VDSATQQILEAFRDGNAEDASAASLRGKFLAAQARWPSCVVPAPLFAAYLAERVLTTPVASAEVLAVDELYLSCACAHGDAEALRLFELHYMPKARAALLAMRLDAHDVDELLQRLRVYLFVHHDGGQLRIVQFRGRGTLGSWLAVSAVRSAYKLLQRETREQPSEDEQLARVTTCDGDQDKSARHRHRAAFSDAFGAALLSLDDREKNLLRQHYLDGLSIDELGLLYRAHRTTTSRWLAAARQRLLERTRSHLMQRLRVPLADCDSIIRNVKSQFDLTLFRFFGAGAAPQAGPA
jgi:RNA polymerase sigma-70 factor (ECF subfamily)